MSRPMVSIVMATYNRAGYLPECLDSLLAQTVAAVEIVLVDDGSEDDTAQVAARYGDRVRYLYQANAGKAAAVNLALAHCSGDWVWLFDDDDVATPNAIETRLAAASAMPEAGVIFSPHFLGSDAPDGTIVRGRLYMPPRPAHEAFFLEVMANCFFHLNSCLVSRTLYERIGGFDKGLLRGQDYDVQIRLARIARFGFCDQPSFVFRQHAGARGPKAIRSEGASRASVFRRYSADLGRKIRCDVPLHEFAVPRASEAMDAPSRRVALSNRLLVMANHGCVEEMLDDLRAMLDTAQSSRLTKPEAAHLAGAIGRGWAYDASADDWPAFVSGLQQAKPLPGGPSAMRAFARGLLSMARSYPGTLAERTQKLRRASELGLRSIG